MGSGVEIGALVGSSWGIRRSPHLGLRLAQVGVEVRKCRHSRRRHAQCNEQLEARLGLRAAGDAEAVHELRTLRIAQRRRGQPARLRPPVGVLPAAVSRLKELDGAGATARGHATGAAEATLRRRLRGEAAGGGGGRAVVGRRHVALTQAEHKANAVAHEALILCMHLEQTLAQLREL